MDKCKSGWLRPSKRFFWALFVCVFVFGGCDRNQTIPTEINGSALGTTYSVKMIPPLSSDTSEKLHQEIKTQLNEIDQSMSVFYENSEISSFNQHQESKWFKLSSAMFEVVQESASISELSKGAFDYTLGNLIDLWGFGKKAKLPAIPGNTKISKALEDSGYAEIHLKPEQTSIRKTNPRIALNLSAIAKGYAVDRVAGVLDRYRIEHYLVEIGGEIRVKGHKKEGKPWLVAIERPDFSRRSIQKIIKLGNKSMATSGDYRNYFEIEGIRFSHTIDSKTGRPVENNIASVSVISDTCMKADALATALMVMGYEKGERFAGEQRLAAFWILRNGSNLSEVMTPDFEQYLN